MLEFETMLVYWSETIC